MRPLILQPTAVLPTPAEVVAHLLDVCDGADREQVERDVRDFLESMRTKGFVGTVAEPA